MMQLRLSEFFTVRISTVFIRGKENMEVIGERV